jgi:hypothetical protein
MGEVISMVNKNILMQELRYELLQLRKKIDSSNDQLPVQLGLPKLLLDIELEINSPKPDKKKLDKEVYGIFRLATESYEFEKSSLGQELLNLRVKIKEFSSKLEASE